MGMINKLINCLPLTTGRTFNFIQVSVETASDLYASSLFRFHKCMGSSQV